MKNISNSTKVLITSLILALLLSLFIFSMWSIQKMIKVSKWENNNIEAVEVKPVKIENSTSKWKLEEINENSDKEKWSNVWKKVENKNSKFTWDNLYSDELIEFCSTYDFRPWQTVNEKVCKTILDNKKIDENSKNYKKFSKFYNTIKDQLQ